MWQCQPWVLTQCAKRMFDWWVVTDLLINRIMPDLDTSVRSWTGAGWLLNRRILHLVSDRFVSNACAHTYLVGSMRDIALARFHG